MAILVNWFEVTFDRKEFTLPFLSCATWDESTPILRQYPEARIVRSRQQDGTIRLYFITGTPVVDHSTEAVPSAGMMSVAARLIESNLGKYFEDQGTRVSSSHWGTEITREVQSFSPIGLTIQQGIHAKYFADLEPKFRHGITLNWIVRPIFTLSIADLPATKNYDGLPVLLRWPESLGPCPNELAPFNQRYIGTILEKEATSGYHIALRDETHQIIDSRALYLEARTDVISEMEQVLSRESGQPTVQRRILQLSHSLKPDGRRNPGILRDQLTSALKMLDPAGRGQASIPLAPNGAGKMWINCFATGVQRS